MKTKDLYKLEDVVKDILENDYLARTDDCYLILRVIQKMHPQMAGSVFTTAMMNAKEKKISFESITRARRKIQKQYPELKDKKTTEARYNEQDEYIKYALN